MGLITKTVTINIGNNKTWYINKGYVIPKQGTTLKNSIQINVKIEDLSNHTKIKVDCECDSCKKKNNIYWDKYQQNINNNNGKYLCKSCSRKVSPKRIIDKSFYDWCSENNKLELIQRWDYKLNSQYTPNNVGYSSAGINRQGYWFKCLNHPEHKSELKNLYSITSGHEKSCSCKQCNSFAQWGIDNICKDFILKYWDYTKNKINPFEIEKSTATKIWIKCQEKSYHGSYETTCNRFYQGRRCPYCTNRKVHPLDSLGNLYPISLDMWSRKNKKSPYEYAPMSNKKVWWKCSSNKHHDYLRDICNSKICNFRCPSCEYSKGEQRIENFFNSNHIKYEPQKKFKDLFGIKGGSLSYDFYLPTFNALIEYQGEQHEKYISGFHLSINDFYKQKEHDKRKKEYAISHKISFLEIWYWNFENVESILNEFINKHEEYIKLSDEQKEKLHNKYELKEVS